MAWRQDKDFRTLNDLVKEEEPLQSTMTALEEQEMERRLSELKKESEAKNQLVLKRWKRACQSEYRQNKKKLWCKKNCKKGMRSKYIPSVTLFLKGEKSRMRKDEVAKKYFIN